MGSKKLYYSISEVAEMFNVQPSLIRFWENEFPVLRPKKSPKGSRQFTERDVRYLHVIYNLVKVQGHTLQGARDAMKTKFDKLEDRSSVMLTLQHAKKFLLSLDEELEKRSAKGKR